MIKQFRVNEETGRLESRWLTDEEFDRYQMDHLKDLIERRGERDG